MLSAVADDSSRTSNKIMGVKLNVGYVDVGRGSKVLATFNCGRNSRVCLTTIAVA